MPGTRVYDLESPATLGFLTPEVDAEEGPVIEVGIENVPGPFEEEGRGCAHGGAEQESQIAAGEETQRDFALNVLEETHLVEGAGAAVYVHGDAESVAVDRVDLTVLIDFLGLANALDRDVCPLLRKTDNCTGVHETVAEFVGDFALYAVDNPTGLLLER